MKKTFWFLFSFVAVNFFYNYLESGDLHSENLMCVLQRDRCVFYFSVLVH